jgi:type I restriction enzyme, S subunit
VRELPAGWGLATIGDITLPVETVDPKSEPSDTFSYVDIGSIDNHINAIVTPKSLRGFEAPSRARQRLKSGDTVFSTVRTYLRNIALVGDSLDGAIASTGFSVLRPAPGVAPRFLHYYSLTSAFVDGLSGQMRGTSYPAVVDSQVRGMPIPVPPTAEQERIVAAIEEHFSRIDAGVAALERARQKLKHMRATVLRAASSGTLVPQDPGDAPAEVWLSAQVRVASPSERSAHPLPCGWALTTIGSLKTWSIYGPRFSSDDYVEEGIPVLRTTDITGSGRILADRAPKLALTDVELDKYKVNLGDLLITRTGSIGTLAYIAEDRPAIPGAYLILYRFGRPIEFSEFLYYLLQSPQVQSHLKGKSAGVGRPNLNAPSIDAIPVPIPLGPSFSESSRQ